jgi:hypothetical protein
MTKLKICHLSLSAVFDCNELCDDTCVGAVQHLVADTLVTPRPLDC